MAETPDNAEGSDDEIVPMRLNSYKPIEVEDAMNELKASDRQFIVFHDMDIILRILMRTEYRFN